MVVLASLAGLGHVGCSDGAGAGDTSQSSRAEAYSCEPDDPVCNQDAGAPRPRWSEQPTRVPVWLIDGGVSIPGVALLAGAVQALYLAVVVIVDRSLTTPVAIMTILGIAAATVLLLVKVLGATQPGEWHSQ